MLSDSEIAHQAVMKPIAEIAASMGIPADILELYGKYKAKIPLSYLDSLRDRPEGKLILVTAVSPTPAGEGKTTITIGLAQALCRLGKADEAAPLSAARQGADKTSETRRRYKAVAALREPSLGPVMGMKGGAAGGGRARIMPMEEINLHFTGDMHAITAAHNLLAAMLDNHLQYGNDLEIDTRQIVWKRALDCNDRALRHIIVGLGGKAQGVPREDGFMITVASEIMAILCLSRDYEDMTARLGRIIVAYDKAGKTISAADLKAQGAMSVLLREALKPNLVQTLEQTPCFVHGGPFANIAHGCNSVLATKMALKMADYAITEAGFGADLGAEKFFDIVCPAAGLKPDAAVLVATIRALKYNGGIAKEDLNQENIAALEKGSVNLRRHLQNIRKFGVPIIVAINIFASDTEAEIDFLKQYCADLGVRAETARIFEQGGQGGEDLARALTEQLAGGAAEGGYHPLYSGEMPLTEKIERIAAEIYGAKSVVYSAAAQKALKDFTATGYGNFPVCIAKTPYSFSDNPKLLGAPEGFEMTVTAAELRAGAGFIVAYMGDIMTMPGLPRRPQAERLYLDKTGTIHNLS